MRIEVNGIEYSGFISSSAEIRLDALSNSFSFTSAGIAPFKIGDPCRIIVNDKTVITGHIEIINGSGDATSREITYSGRDKTGDLVDSNIGALSDLGTSISLKTIIEKVISNIDSTLKVIDQVSPKNFNPAEDIASPEPGDNAFDFIEKLARKRQVILTSNSDGNIVIVDTPGDNLIHALQNVLGADNNNVKSFSFSYDETGRYNLYKMVSSLNPTALSFSGATNNSDVVNQSGNVTDKAIRAGRQLVITAEGSYSNTENNTRAEWEQRIRQARGRLYSAVVQGFTPPGSSDLWQVNTIIGVLDDFAGISAEMLINSIVFSLSEDGGSTTTLSLVEQNAYNLQLTEPVTEKIGDSLAF